MKRLFAAAIGCLVVALTLTGCATQPSSEGGWMTLFDGTNLNNFKRVGDANWRIDDGLVIADLGGKAPQAIW